MPADYRDDLRDWFDQQMMRDPDVKTGQMMGHPGYACEINNKLFMMFSGDGILLKVTPGRNEEMLARQDVTPFMPMGMKKQMGTWIIWTKLDAEEYEAEWSIIMESKNYVASEPPNKKKGKRK